MSSGDTSGIVQSSTASGCFPLRMGVEERCALVRPRYEAGIAAGADHVCFWTNLNQVN